MLQCILAVAWEDKGTQRWAMDLWRAVLDEGIVMKGSTTPRRLNIAETERQTRQSKRQKDRETETETETERRTDEAAETETETETHRQRQRQIHRDTQTDRQTESKSVAILAQG